MIRIASDCFAYYESPETSVVYNEDSSLTANMWFKSEENLRTFINRVAETHLNYRLPAPISWKYTFEAATAPHVRPVMTMDYSKGESLSPDYTPVQSVATDVSAANASNAEVYFRLVEKPGLFSCYNPTSCHIADKKDFPEYDENPDNRLYLSQPVHYLFDGYQTAGSGKLSKKYPYLGIYFVRDEGEEAVNFNGVQYHMHRIIIAFEAIKQEVIPSINFKEGSFIEDDIMHTHIHVNNPDQAKLFLSLKYRKTAKKWDEQEIIYRHREPVEDEQHIENGIAGLSLEKVL